MEYLRRIRGKNYRALNNDGTWSEIGKKIPKLTNSIKDWIVSNGWNLPNN